MKRKINDMTTPQLKNGFLKLSNELAEVFQKVHLTGNEWRVLWVILRQTYGWEKKTEKISQTYFARQTGIARRNIGSVLGKLLRQNIIIKNDDTYIITYGLQKDYRKWHCPETIIVSNDSKLNELSLEIMHIIKRHTLYKRNPDVK